MALPRLEVLTIFSRCRGIVQSLTMPIHFTGIWRPIIIRKNIPSTKWVYLVPVYLWGPKKCYPKIFQRENFEILTDTLIRSSHPMLNENLKMLET